MPRPTRTDADLVRVANAIANDDHPSISYMGRLFVQVSLPYRDPGPDVPVWTRRNGDLTLFVQPGFVQTREGDTVSVGYPSGVMPRLLVNWISTEVARTRSAELELGASLNTFMAKLNLTPTGGKNGSITKLRQQMERLFNARLSVRRDTADKQTGIALNIAKAWELHWPSHAEHPGQTSLLPSVVQLSEDFYQQLVENPVPVSMDALIALRGSALRLDIYAWLTYRMSYLQKPTTISWESLRGQFGSSLADTRSGRAQFKRDFTRNLAQVLKVYPQARAEILDTGLKLRPSQTHVPFRGLGPLRYGRLPGRKLS